MKLFIKKMIIAIFILFISLGLSGSFVVEAAGKLAEGSTIGNVLLQGLTYGEARDKLQDEIDKWRAGEPLIAESENERQHIPRSVFEFDVKGSLNDLESQTKHGLFSFFKKTKEVHLPIKIGLNDTTKDLNHWPDYIDQEATLEKARTIASTLDEHVIAIAMKEDVVVELETIAKVEQSVPEDLSIAALERVVKELNKQIIYYDRPFSFLETVILPEKLSDSTEEMSFVATGLYGLLLKTNMEVIERHSQGYIPTYSKAGVDVAVSPGEQRDFNIFNPNDFSYTIKAEIKDEKLILTLDSFLQETTYKYELENELEVEPRTIYRFSRDLKAGKQEVIEVGKKGLQVDIYRINLSDTDEELDRMFMSHEFYPPVPEIILISTHDELPAENTEGNQDGESIDVNADQNVRYIEKMIDERNSTMFFSCLIQSMYVKDIPGLDSDELMLDCLLNNLFENEYVEKEDDEDNDTGAAENKFILDCLARDTTGEEDSDVSSTDLILDCLIGKEFKEKVADVPEEGAE